MHQDTVYKRKYVCMYVYMCDFPSRLPYQMPSTSALLREEEASNFRPAKVSRLDSASSSISVLSDINTIKDSTGPTLLDNIVKAYLKAKYAIHQSDDNHCRVSTLPPVSIRRPNFPTFSNTFQQKQRLVTPISLSFPRFFFFLLIF